MAEHELKVATAYFDALASGEKNFEVRRDDRGFQRGDVLVLRRYGKSFSSAIGAFQYLRGTSNCMASEADTVRRRITYVLTGGQFGIEPGFVVLGLAAEPPARSGEEAEHG